MRVCSRPARADRSTQLLRDGIAWYYHGVVHEVVKSPTPVVHQRLTGNYHIEDRQRSWRNLSGRKLGGDRDLLAARGQPATGPMPGRFSTRRRPTSL